MIEFWPTLAWIHVRHSTTWYNNAAVQCDYCHQLFFYSAQANENPVTDTSKSCPKGPLRRIMPWEDKYGRSML